MMPAPFANRAAVAALRARMGKRAAPIKLGGTLASAQEALMALVEFDTAGGCWLWAHSLTRSGYGVFRQGGRAHRAHRAAYRIFRGEDPGDLMVCHRCDTPACINPAHLWLGTAADNAADRDAKGRRADVRPPVLWGAANHASKLTPARVQFIRENPDMPAKVLSGMFGVSGNAIGEVRRGGTWR